jgi:hypothetical protein
MGYIMSLGMSRTRFQKSKSDASFLDDCFSRAWNIRFISAKQKRARTSRKKWVLQESVSARYLHALWVGVGTVGRNEPLTYDGARALLGRRVLTSEAFCCMKNDMNGVLNGYLVRG